VNTTFEDLYFGFAYLAVGEAPRMRSSTSTVGNASSG